MEATENDLALIFDDPLDELALGELHGLGEGGGEVDVPLNAGLALNKLDTGRETHIDHLQKGCLVV